MDADADSIDIEEYKLSNSNGTIADSDEDDAGIFTIVNDYSSEDDDTLADKQEEERNIYAGRTRRIGHKNTSSAERFLLSREAVILFVQDSIIYAVDRQKRNANKNGRANTLSLIEDNLVLLSTVNLPRHEITNFGSFK